MKIIKAFLLVVFTVSWFPIIYGQDDSVSTVTLKKFSGGSINFEFFMSNWLLSGIGQKSSSMAGAFSSFKPNVEDLFNNPAGIAYMRKAGLMLEMSPRLPVPIARLYDVKGKIHDEEMKQFTDKKQFESYPSNIKNNLTDIKNVSAGQFGGVKSWCVALPLRYFNFGFGYTNPFDLHLKMLGSGIEIIAEADVDPSGLTSALSIDMLVDLEFRSHMASMAIAREFGHGFAGSITLDKHDYSLSLIGNVVPQGIVTTNSDFTLTDKDFQNSIAAQFAGSALGTRLGLSYHAKKLVCFDMFLQLIPSIDMTGTMTVKQDTFSLFKGATIAPENIDLSDPLARKGFITNPTSDHITLKLPNSFNAGIGLHNGKFGAAFNYTKYFNELSFKFIDNRQGMKFGHKFMFGMDAQYFKMGLGLMTYDAVENFPDTSKSFIKISTTLKNLADSIGVSKDLLELVPVFTLGIAFPIKSSININTVLLALPVSVLKTTLVYNWEMRGLAKRAKKIDPMSIFDEAMRLYQTKRYWDAAYTFGHLITSFPKFSKNNEALYYVGESFNELELVTPALEAYQKMMTVFPSDKLLEEVMFKIGHIYYKTGQYDKVKEQYQTMLKDFPNSKIVEKLAYLAGQAQFKSQKYKEAIELYKQVTAECESYKYAQYAIGLASLYLEDVKTAIQSFKNVLVRPGSNPAEKLLDDRTHLQVGYIYYEMVDYAAALVEFAAVRDSTSRYLGDALIGKAWAAIKQKRYPEAITALESLVKHAPKSVLGNEAYLVLGHCYSMQHDYDKAIQNYKMAVSESSVPTGIRKSQIPNLTQEKEKRVTDLVNTISQKSAPAVQTALLVDGPEKKEKGAALEREIALKKIELDSARTELGTFMEEVASITVNEQIMQDAKYALPTAEHAKMTKDKSFSDQEYEEKLKKLEEQMRQKIKEQQKQ